MASDDDHDTGEVPCCPPFPPSALKLIMDYHRAHSNSLRLAHTIGTGSSYAAHLADYFQHVHVSRSDGAALRESREQVSAYYRENWWKARFSFSESVSEQSHLAVAGGSVDLALLEVAREWNDVDDLVGSVAHSLAPNGTMVVVSVAKVPRVLEADQRVDRAVRELFREFGRSFAAHEDHFAWYNSPLDFIPLQHEQGDAIWIQDVTKRIKINLADRDDMVFMIPECEERIPESRIGPAQRRYWLAGDDAEAKGWREEVDAAWFSRYIAKLQSPYGQWEYEKLLREVEDAIRESTADGKVVLEWAAAFLLATKK